MASALGSSSDSICSDQSSGTISFSSCFGLGGTKPQDVLGIKSSTLPPNTLLPSMDTICHENKIINNILKDTIICASATMLTQHREWIKLDGLPSLQDLQLYGNLARVTSHANPLIKVCQFSHSMIHRNQCRHFANPEPVEIPGGRE